MSKSRTILFIFLLDEFGNLQLPQQLFPQVISLIRQKKCSLSLAVQSLSQLQETYGAYGSETIMANIGTWIVLAGAKDEKNTLLRIRISCWNCYS